MPTTLTPLLLRSDRVQEIISRQPGFFERWALWLFLLLLCLLGAGTWFIKYPDVIETGAILSSANAPKEIVIRQDGKLVRLFVGNDDTVASGQTVGWIESTADHRQVIALSGLLLKAESYLSTGQTEKVSGLFVRGFDYLGDLQTAYQQFITAWLQFNDYLENGYYYKRKASLDEDYAFLQHMHGSVEEQQRLTRQDLDLTKEAFAANDSLFRDSVVSRQDMRDQRSKLVGKQLSSEQLASSLLTNENQQVAKQRDIAELEHTISQQKIIFRQALETLKSLTDEWMRKYILRAAVAGKVVFLIPLQENQFMQAGKTIGYINPTDSRYYAQVTLPQSNFGKLRTGQRVQLRLDAYPYQEFGFIEGRLGYISKVPSDSGFLASVELPNGLRTNYRKELQYRSGLKSRALIITRDTRLIQRLLYTFIKETSIN
jgi:multidrug efflux pump subunit AcrA (membrane-fusion protein)